VRSVAIVTSLSGCMVIYPDPELPDIKLEWSGECDAGSEISIGLVNLDEGTTTRYAAPCTDNKLTLEDVDRKLFRVDGALVQADGSVSATASGEADLRNGFNKETFLYCCVKRVKPPRRALSTARSARSAATDCAKPVKPQHPVRLTAR
jgi:hypothetical protein